MQPGNWATLALLAVAMLIVGMAVPLILGRVKRNRWYGFRTPTTLSSDHIWYPANRALGWGMLWNGLIMAALVSAVLLHIPGFSLLILLAYLPLSTAVLLGFGYHKLSQLK
jgi:hypothetical protein